MVEATNRSDIVCAFQRSAERLKTQQLYDFRSWVMGIIEHQRNELAK